MNEKLQALRRQAVITSSNKIRAESGTGEIDEDDIQSILDLRRVEFDKTFAELIIKECIDLMKDKQTYYENPCSYESTSYYDRMDAKADAFSDAVCAIKYHFSV